jgi:hypothetical protein
MLETLDISNNEIGDESAVKLGHAFIINKSLRQLHFYENDLTPIGWQAISILLKPPTSKSLILNISCGDIDDEGVIALFSALFVPSQLLRE